MSRHWDVLALVGTAISFVIAITALALTDLETDASALLYIVPLLLATSAGLYGARRDAAGRRRALIWAGVVVTVLAVLSLPSIGIPLVPAGILLIVAGRRHRDEEVLAEP